MLCTYIFKSKDEKSFNIYTQDFSSKSVFALYFKFDYVKSKKTETKM